MKLVINHDACRHSGEFADRCLAASLRDPYRREKYCAAQILEDGRDEVTVTLIMDGRAHQRVFRTDEERQIAADRGWPAFMEAGPSLVGV